MWKEKFRGKRGCPSQVLAVLHLQMCRGFQGREKGEQIKVGWLVDGKKKKEEKKRRIWELPGREKEKIMWEEI